MANPIEYTKLPFHAWRGRYPTHHGTGPLGDKMADTASFAVPSGLPRPCRLVLGQSD